MPFPTRFLENLHHVPADGWTRSAYTVLRAGKVEAAPDYGIGRDAHPGQDILFCAEGSGTVETLGQKAELRPGQLLWIANESPHAHAANPADPWTLLWFRLDGPDPAGLRRNLFGDGLARSSFSRDAHPSPWFDRLFAMLRSRPRGIDLRLNQMVGEFLLMLDRSMVGQTPDALPVPLAAIVGAMRTNLKMSWSANELAAVSGLGPSQIRRLFQKHLRTSPRRWLIRERLMQAQAMLVETDEPISGIAELCGFCDVYHLGREFRRSVGAPPAAWRRNERGAGRQGRQGRQAVAPVSSTTF